MLYKSVLDITDEGIHQVPLDISSANFSVEHMEEFVFGGERAQDTVEFKENVKFCSTKQNDDVNNGFDYPVNDDFSINE